MKNIRVGTVLNKQTRKNVENTFKTRVWKVTFFYGFLGKIFFVSPAYDGLDVRSWSRRTRVSAKLPYLLSITPARLFYSSRSTKVIQIITHVKYVSANAAGVLTYLLNVFKRRHHRSKRRFYFSNVALF